MKEEYICMYNGGEWYDDDYCVRVKANNIEEANKKYVEYLCSFLKENDVNYILSNTYIIRYAGLDEI